MNQKESASAIMWRERDQIDTNIQHITKALSQTADDHPNMRLLLACLDSAHNDRFNLLGESNDIDIAIEYTYISLTLTPDNDPGLPSMLGDLGARHGKRFERLGSIDDNYSAIEYVSLALSLTPNGHPSSSIRLGNLAGCHIARFRCLGVLGDLEKGIEYQFRALSLTPHSDPKLWSLLSNLGGFLKDRFERLGELEDLEKAIEYESHALASIPDDHPYLPILFANLGGCYDRRFRRLGELGDLEKAIECHSRALVLIPDGHPQSSIPLANLAASLKKRFKRLGELGDLEKVIEYESRALTLTPDGHPDFSSRLADLGRSHIYRLQRLGEPGDLEKAIEYQSRALSLTPDGHPRLSDLLSNLGEALKIRFERLGELEYLEKAIEYESQALTLAPHDHPHLPLLLGNLATSYLYRSHHLRELGDLEKAMGYRSQALALIPDNHPDLLDQLQNLAVSHAYRFRRLQHWDDLEKAIKLMSNALDFAPDSHPSLPDRRFSLAMYLLMRYQHMDYPQASDLRSSLHSFRMATQSLEGSPRDKFMYAIQWAKRASVEASLNCIEAYQTAIDLLPQYVWLGTTTIQRYQDLTSAKSLATDASLVAILASDYGLALEWLEHARCVVWNQNLMLRSPLDELRHRNPALATRLQTVAAQLHHAGSESRESQSLASGSLSAEQVAQRHRQLAQEYTDLISHARAISGFEDFLRPMKANGLVRAARSGPIVVITCHERHCDALVDMPGQNQIRQIPLPNFTRQKAQISRQQMGKSMRNCLRRERGVERRPVLEDGYRLEFQSVLSSLWYDIVKPVLDHLGYMIKVSGGSLPHVTWCPTGALSFLPLHAAGDYNQPQSKTYDYVMSSYTPTLTALLSSTPSSLTPNSRVLAIGQPHTPGHSRLSGTTEELAYLQNHISGVAKYSQLVGDQATTKAVLDAMEQHDWVHLACHAHQNVGDPTKSGFFLHDGALDLGSINQRSFKGKGLAYLSACQTATGDETLPDEAIHLASGMLMAGYSSVIATMWSVMDADAPFVADKVYSQLMKGSSVGNGEAGKALHYAVAELRKKVGEDEFERWVPYIHIGS